MKNVVENQEMIVEEILKNCNFYEKIIIKMNKRLLTKLFNIIRINIVNNMLN